MKCPVCTGTDLLMAERQGVEIDYCPECRGIWLDRGELDKIVERMHAEYGTAPQAPAHVAPQAPPPQAPVQAAPAAQYSEPRDAHYEKHHDKHRDEHYESRDHRYHEQKKKHKKKPKGSFLLDMFEGLGGD